MTPTAEGTEPCPYGACDHTEDWHSVRYCYLCSCPEQPELLKRPEPAPASPLVERLGKVAQSKLATCSKPTGDTIRQVAAEAAAAITALEAQMKFHREGEEQELRRAEAAEKALREIKERTHEDDVYEIAEAYFTGIAERRI